MRTITRYLSLYELQHPTKAMTIDNEGVIQLSFEGFVCWQTNRSKADIGDMAFI